MNQRETIDGITGEWRTVTKPSELSERQPIRYEIGCVKFGYDSPSCAERCKMCRTISIFGDGQRKNIQAFFPLADKRKVAKVEIHTKLGLFEWHIYDLEEADVRSNDFVETKDEALRGARRFCKAIGYEMEVVSDCI
jgi:hypothetical protein